MRPEPPERTALARTSNATVAPFLDELPGDRRAGVSAVRCVVLRSMDEMPLDVIASAIASVRLARSIS